MQNADFHDMLTVRKGPEDGSEFPITASPILIGRDASCVVQIQFDVTVQPIHAHATATQHGYRIRSAEGAPVYVDGRKTGMIRSRLLTPKGVLKIGYTELVLSCSGAGVSSMAKPSWGDRDIAFVFKALGKKASRLLYGIRYGIVLIRIGLWKIISFMFRHWVLTLIVVILASYQLGPEFRDWISDTFIKPIKDLLDS